jgi:DNA-binding CsgD family transcriptional regulator
MLAADAQGEVKWATPQAQQILVKLSLSSDAPLANGIALPPLVRTWVSRSAARAAVSSNDTIVVVAHDLKIRFRLLSRVSDDEILLVMQQAEPVEIERAGISKLETRLGLTSREAEVLYWLSNGKANRDIAEILGISYCTVDKHLEHLFTKVGVESRSSAVATAVRIVEE